MLELYCIQQFYIFIHVYIYTIIIIKHSKNFQPNLPNFQLCTKLIVL